jgi:hypothetical protein
MTYHLLVPNIKKIRSLNVPDPHGPVEACSGTALLFLLLFCNSVEFGPTHCQRNMDLGAFETSAMRRMSENDRESSKMLEETA